jgi:fructose-specific phosphotransferase system IIA component
MELTELKEKGLIALDLRGENKFQVIDELLALLHVGGHINDLEVASRDVLEREQYLSTGLEKGIAIPHGKTPAVDELCLAFGRNRTGVDFDSLDGKPAQLIFLVLSPEEVSGPHIQFLAKISRNLKQPEKRQALLQADNIDQIHQAFLEFE